MGDDKTIYDAGGWCVPPSELYDLPPNVKQSGGSIYSFAGGDASDNTGFVKDVAAAYNTGAAAGPDTASTCWFQRGLPAAPRRTRIRDRVRAIRAAWREPWDIL